MKNENSDLPFLTEYMRYVPTLILPFDGRNSFDWWVIMPELKIIFYSSIWVNHDFSSHK
jgi:hypothetical protein